MDCDADLKQVKVFSIEGDPGPTGPAGLPGPPGPPGPASAFNIPVYENVADLPRDGSVSLAIFRPTYGMNSGFPNQWYAQSLFLFMGGSFNRPGSVPVYNDAERVDGTWSQHSIPGGWVQLR